jgi:hypothetical protein
MALRALAGIARGQPKIEPMVNVVEEKLKKNGALKAATGGNMPEMFLAWMQANKKQQVTPTEVKEWLKANGRSVLSGSYLSKNLVRKGFLKRRGKSSQTVYTVK